MPVDSRPEIQNYTQISLTQLEEEALILLFLNYEKLVLKAEFGGGFGGGRVLLVRPFDMNGDAELPTVIKLGPAEIITEEWEAFAQYIANKVPNVASVEGEPVFTSNGQWGAVRYPLAGDGVFEYVSFAIFCLEASADSVTHVLEQQLFPSLNMIWQNSKVSHEFFLARSLDAILPVNLVASYQATSATATMLQPKQEIQIGDEFFFSNFIVTEVDHLAGEITLDVPVDDDWSGGYRFRVKDVPDTNRFQVNHLLPHPIVGRVEATRDSLLQTVIENAFSITVDLSQREISLPNMDNLPNPVEYLTKIFRKTEDVRIGVVHGDLNLENILVEYDNRNRNIHLIDFARARKDWILHDLLRLETNFWLYVVSSEMAKNGRSLADIEPLLFALHTNTGQVIAGQEKPLQILTTVRHRVRMLLVNPNSWNEYYQGLIVYLLGALKFKNLDAHFTAPLPKQIAFVVAAILQKLSDPAQNLAMKTSNQISHFPEGNVRAPMQQNNNFQQTGPPSQQAPVQANSGNTRQQYLVILEKSFNTGELQDICFRLNIDYEDLPGVTRKDRLRELYLHLARRSMINSLSQIIHEIRPEIVLPSIDE